MPLLSRVLTAEDLHPSNRGINLDLTAYVQIIERVTRDGGVGGAIRLAEEESQRTEKRRLTLAAKQQGYQLKWRSATPRTLRFVLDSEEKPAPRGRLRRMSAQGQSLSRRSRRSLAGKS